MRWFLEYLGVTLIGIGLVLSGLTVRNPEYWCFILGITLYVKFGGWKK